VISLIEEAKILPLYTFSHEPAVGFAADAAAIQASGHTTLGVLMALSKKRSPWSATVTGN